MKNAFLAFLLLLCSGCSFSLSSNYESPRFYVLRDVNESKDLPYAVIPLRLEVAEVSANRFINSQKIIYSDNHTTLQYYRLASWVETPPRRLTSIFIERLRKPGLFLSVTEESTAAAADVQLNMDLLEFYQDTASDPGKVRIKLWAELLDLKTRKIVAGRLFESSAKVKSYDVEGAVGAFEVAVDKLFDSLYKWFIKTAKESCPAPQESVAPVAQPEAAKS